MSAFSQGTRRMQEKLAAAAVAYANPDRNLLFVSSTNGKDGNDGDSPRHALATLARAVALASDGDTIICEPGGSETLAATISVTQDHLNIVCPVVDPNAGYTLTGAGTVDLLTVSGADVSVEGLRFTRTATAGGTTAGLLTTADADRLAVINCIFDCSDSTSSWTNYGIELTDDIIDVVIRNCAFVDCHRGVLFATSTGKDQVGAKIELCEFWVGRDTAFGIYALAAGSGANTGIIVKDSLFFELNGSGAAATDAWNGTNGANGASGPLYFGAATDQYIIANCRCSGATVSFVNRCTVISGAAGTISDSVSGLDDSSAIATISTAVSTVSTAVSTAGAAVGTVSTAVSTVGANLGTASTAISTVSTAVSTVGANLGTASTAISTVSTAISTVSTAQGVINGWDVRTVKKSDLSLHQGTVADIFTVANGPVEVLALVLQITEAVSAHNMTAGFESDPTVGASNTPLCAVVDLISAAIGDAFATVGAGGSAMVKYANGTAPALANVAPAVVFPGGIDYVPANDTPTSGIGDVYLTYRPLSATAVVT
ncbi:MAG: hypothetical protein ABIL09_21310 [Gemmatimonadota bacterium]